MQLRNVGMIFGCGVLSLGMGQGSVAAEPAPPISQLPKDVAHLAVVWMAVPQAIYEVTQDDGVVEGVTRGTVEGSSHMVENTVKQMTRGYSHQAHEDSSRPRGALLTYSF